MTDFHIPTPDESNQKRQEKKSIFSWRKAKKDPLEVAPEVGQNKTVDPAPRMPVISQATQVQEPAPPPPAPTPSKPRAVAMSPEVVQVRGGVMEPEISTQSRPTFSIPDLPTPVILDPVEPARPPHAVEHDAPPPPKLPDLTAGPPTAAGYEPTEPAPPSTVPEQEPSLAQIMKVLSELQEEVRELRDRVDRPASAATEEQGGSVSRGPTVEEPLQAPTVDRASLMQGSAAEVDSLLGISPPYPPDDLATAARQRGELLFMTNRLNPLKLSVRVLANMRATAGEWPQLVEFQKKAAWAARTVGLRLKREDEQRKAPRAERRAIAYPTGPKVEQSLQRFIMSFTLDTHADHGGPLQLLNLARVEDERAILTSAGWALASQSGPLLDGDEGHLLSEGEDSIFRHQLQESPGEGAAIAQFLRLVQESRGIQTMLDEYLDETLPEWITDVVSWRGGMLGRLRDVGIVEVDGEGKNARIRLTDAARSFLRAWPEE